MKKKSVIALLSLLILLSATGCESNLPDPSPSSSPSVPPITEEEMRSLSLTITTYLETGEFEALMEMMDATMNDLTKAEDWKAAWEQLIEKFGSYQGTGAMRIGSDSGYGIVEHTLVFETSKLIQRTVFDTYGMVAGLFFNPGVVPDEDSALDVELPEGATETEVTIESQPGYPLSGTLTLPAGEVKAAVVLVHGSGPNDRDETVGANKPFRDIAYGLAENGIAVLRYDKVTYTYGSEISKGSDYSRFTVDEETVIDAVNAVNWLKSHEGIDENRVFLLGHSLSAGLLPYAGVRGADVAGYISLAGTPRSLLDVVNDQNQMFLDDLAAEGKNDNYNSYWLLISSELAKAERLSTMSEEELLSETLYGVPAWYFKHLSGINPIALYMADETPLLIMQGQKDRQVYADVDYAAWREGLKNHPNATFKLYGELNHLFGNYEGDAVPFSQMVNVEYAQRTRVPGYVISDISDWILSEVN